MPFALSTNSAGIVAYDVETGETAAILIAQDWTVTTCQVHQVILKTMVLRHRWLEEIGTWLFTNSYRLKLYALVPGDNAMALKLNAKMGFKELIRLEDAYDHGVDFVLMELRREDCPYWIQPEMQEAANG